VKRRWNDTEKRKKETRINKTGKLRIT